MLLASLLQSKMCHHVTMSPDYRARTNIENIPARNEHPADATQPKGDTAASPTPVMSMPRHRFRLLREFLPMLLIVLIVFGGVRIFFQPYEVDGASMAPAISNGERLFVNRSAYTHLDLPVLGDIYPFSGPQRGDIVVLDSGRTSRDASYIKRIIGLPGETITYTEGIVVIDGEPLVEDYIDGAITRCHIPAYCSITIPQGHVYILGDNRMASEDSRFFGPIPVEDITGKAFFSNWPYEDIGPIQHPDYGEIRAGS